MNARAIMTAAADIEKAIVSIKTRGAKLDGDIQHCALSVLSHVDHHGDTTLADRLVHAMPKGSRKLALVEFLLAFGRMRKLDPSTERDQISAGRLFAYEKKRVTKLDEATAMPWTDFKREASPLTAFDAQAATHSLIQRLKKAAENKLDIQGVDEAVREATQLLADLKAIRAEQHGTAPTHP